MCSFHFAFSFFLSLTHSLVFLLLFIIYGFLRIILYEQMRLRIIVRSLWAGNSFDHNSHNLGTYIAKTTTTTTINITSASTQPASLSFVAERVAFFGQWFISFLSGFPNAARACAEVFQSVKLSFKSNDDCWRPLLRLSQSFVGFLLFIGLIYESPLNGKWLKRKVIGLI